MTVRNAVRADRDCEFEMQMASMPAPHWYRRSMATPADVRTIRVAGCSIAFRCWGPVGAPGIVLVHGTSGHSRWWDHIAPLIGDEYRIAALDLSGHGDSGRRDEYSADLWATEVITVSAAAAMAGPPVVIGHSMGGLVALNTGVVHSERPGGVVAIEWPIRESHRAKKTTARAAGRSQRVYPDRAEALARFWTVNGKDEHLPYVLDHVASTSIEPAPGGWTWKFDPNVLGASLPDRRCLRHASMPVALLRGQRGLVAPDVGDQVCELLGRPVQVIELPLAGHFPMLDQPLALIVGLHSVLADWESSGHWPHQP
ncbi:alpha/beta hydrolase [Lentzea sp. NPDC004782]|uniref:alpha/beta fold hydrolase n=1 Tax=Lentzea sp. NPDC004782 TaxID=3154458 RepID=UPI0033A1FAAD